MPSPKQLNCSIELGNANIKLEEYGTVYSDGYVGTIVAVPEEEINFTIHLTSDGYIAPGIAMFVYIDGQYQCNRNRRGLVVPDEKTSSEHFQVDLRVRQKETKQADTAFHGRAWSFHKLNTVAADKAPRINTTVMDNIGTIEVVVLRCKEVGMPTTRVPSPKSTRPASVPDQKPHTAKPKVQAKKKSTPAPSAQSGGMLMGIFDGPADQPGVYYREQPVLGVLAARATGGAGTGYNGDPFQYRPIPAQIQSAYEIPDPVAYFPRPVETNAHMPAYHQPYGGFQFPQPAQSGDQGNAVPQQVNVPSYGYPQHTYPQHPANGIPPNAYPAQEVPHYTTYEPRARYPPPGYVDPFTSRPRDVSQQEWPSAGPYSQRWTESTPQSNEASYGASDPGRRASETQYPYGNSYWTAQPRAGEWPAEWHWNPNHPWYERRRVNSTPRDEPKSEAASKKKTVEKNATPSSKKTTVEKAASVVPGAWVEDPPKAESPHKSSSGANAQPDPVNVEPSPVKETKDDQEAVENKDENKPASQAADWGWPDEPKADDKPASQAADSKATKQSKHDKHSKKRHHHNKAKPEKPSEPDGQNPTGTSDGAASSPRIKPYFSDWYKAPVSILSDSATAPKTSSLYVAPAEPLIPVSEDKATKKGVDHQVRIGEAAHYTHLVSRPTYLDSPDRPYAVFNFRYRSRKVVEKMCGVTIKEKKEEIIKVKLEDMSKAQLVEEMLKMKLKDKKKASAVSSSSSSSSSSRSSSTTLRASSSRSMKAGEKVADWNATVPTSSSSSTTTTTKVSSRHERTKSKKSSKSKDKSVVAAEWDNPAARDEAAGGAMNWDNVPTAAGPTAPNGPTW